MFFEGQRIVEMRKMILADDEGRKTALAALGRISARTSSASSRRWPAPVTIRLLDPPLHEFLPHDDAGQSEVARQLGIPPEKVRRRVTQLHEANPMLGLRGCRLAIRYPEIGDMQVRAIIEAAIEVASRGHQVLPEIMIPLVGTVEELSFLKKRAVAIADEVMARKGKRIEYLIGTMIEVPRAALCADEIAREAEFFSFGTNDLTQMTFGFSRDDISSFMPTYMEQKILKVDPFQTLDATG
ncbi:MAG: putative PEP-binding protein, partial [Singulisphaera sp.]